MAEEKGKKESALADHQMSAIRCLSVSPPCHPSIVQ